MLSSRDKDELRLESFVFHVLVKEEEAPKLLDEVILTERQRVFFKEWLSKSISSSIEYEFRDRDKEGGVCQLAIKAVENNCAQFIEVSKNLSKEFKRFHKGSSSDGILIIALVVVETGHLLYMVKMDYSETLQYEIEELDGRRVARLSEVENPINESSQAIQKAAIINIDSQYTWDVLAQDKQSPINYKIAEYFQNFLDVREKEVASVLTREIHKAVKQWVRENQSNLDPIQNITDYSGRGYDYLVSHDEFDAEELVRCVVVDSNEERRVALRESLLQKLDVLDLRQRSFPLRRGSIANRESKNIWKTHMDVQIIFHGSPEANNIRRTRNPESGEEVIMITTSSIRFQ